MKLLIAVLALASLFISSADARPRHKRPVQVATIGGLGIFAGSSHIASMRAKLGQGRPAGCPSQWCGCAMAIELGGGSNRAIDYLHRGTPAPRGAIGSIAVSAHHVGFVTGECAGGVMLISGNGGGGRYTEICYRRPIIGFRWP